MAPITPAISRKRSFWRKRVRSRRSDEQPAPLLAIVETVQEKTEQSTNSAVSPESPDSLESSSSSSTPISPTEGKMHRIIGWMKSWHHHKDKPSGSPTNPEEEEETEAVSPTSEERASADLTDGTLTPMT